MRGVVDGDQPSHYGTSSGTGSNTAGTTTTTVHASAVVSETCGAGAASGLAVEALLVLDDGVVRMTDGAIDGMLPNLDGIKLFCLICK